MSHFFWYEESTKINKKVWKKFLNSKTFKNYLDPDNDIFILRMTPKFIQKNKTKKES